MPRRNRLVETVRAQLTNAGRRNHRFARTDGDSTTVRRTTDDLDARRSPVREALRQSRV